MTWGRTLSGGVKATSVAVSARVIGFIASGPKPEVAVTFDAARESEARPLVARQACPREALPRVGTGILYSRCARS